MKTVHVILNAHLDPVWLWPWSAGLDAALATCRSACDVLDRYSDTYFTQGEAWVHREVERVDPELFERIRAHVAVRRWHVVGGWWTQPDCNLPSGFAFKKQITLGKAFFLERFGFFPRTAYNIDSFGHAASLPDIMHEGGQDRYVMMRPGPHEMPLPARVFRWRGREGGPQIVTFRIAGSYGTGDLSVAHFETALTSLPEGIDHTMCFVGVGDHGGGPTDEQVKWVRRHKNAIDGCRLVFSTPDAFFDAIQNDMRALPVVTGELQHHAVGCYSVCRPVKTAVRRAEHLLRSAEIVRGRAPRTETGFGGRIREGWERVCLHHFHDTLGGTCIPSAYVQVLDQLGWAAAVADEGIQYGLRRMMNRMPGGQRQRIVALNASDGVFDGYVRHEPWLEWRPWQPGWRLLDEDGKAVPYQVSRAEAFAQGLSSIVFRMTAAPGEHRVFSVDTGTDGSDALIESQELGVPLTATPSSLGNSLGLKLGISDEAGITFPDGARLELPRFELVEDATDTWSHGVDRYGEAPVDAARWEESELVDRGPLVASLRRYGVAGRSEMTAEWRVYTDEPFVELVVRVVWLERHKVLKMVFPVPGLVRRRDGIPGSELERAPDGAERPVRDRTLLEFGELGREAGDAARVGLVFPDVFALDATSERVRLTLLRSPLMAHHDPYEQAGPGGTFSDRGEHVFRFRIFSGRDLAPAELDRHALQFHRPPVIADITRGMRR